MYNRDGKNDLNLTKERVHLGTGGAAAKILDLETGKARSITLQDVYQLTRLVDQLDNIRFLVRPFIPTNIPEKAYDGFMTSPHTLKTIRQESFDGNGLTDATSRDNWEKKDSQDAFARAREFVGTLLAEEAISYIPKEIDQVIREKNELPRRRAARYL